MRLDHILGDGPAVRDLVSARLTDRQVLLVDTLQPDEDDSGITGEIVGLDDARSWIIVSEGNEFDWPGYDLRKIGRADRYDYGFLPPRFFSRVLETFMAWHRANRATLTSRE